MLLEFICELEQFLVFSEILNISGFNFSLPQVRTYVNYRSAQQLLKPLYLHVLRENSDRDWEHAEITDAFRNSDRSIENFLTSLPERI